MEDRFKHQYLSLKQIKKGLFEQYALQQKERTGSDPSFLDGRLTIPQKINKMLDHQKTLSLMPKKPAIVLKREDSERSHLRQDYIKCQPFEDKQYITIENKETHIIVPDSPKSLFANPKDIDLLSRHKDSRQWSVSPAKSQVFKPSRQMNGGTSVKSTM